MHFRPKCHGSASRGCICKNPASEKRDLGKRAKPPARRLTASQFLRSFGFSCLCHTPESMDIAQTQNSGPVTDMVTGPTPVWNYWVMGSTCLSSHNKGERPPRIQVLPQSQVNSPRPPLHCCTRSAQPYPPPSIDIHFRHGNNGLWYGYRYAFQGGWLDR